VQSALVVIVMPPGDETPNMDAKLKHLEFIQAVITRMATNSFLFKGWAITIAAGLAAFAAVESRTTLLVLALASTVMFWGLDGYYLWLEHCFIELHNKVATKKPAEIDFAMTPDKTDAAKGWMTTCICRPHLWLFYGTIIFVDVIGIILIRSK
jgi:hypothetical protein